MQSLLNNNLEALLAEIRELKASVSMMEKRGERVPLEIEEKLHAIEEIVEEMEAALRRTVN